MRGILTHLRGNAVAYIALFVALGGTSYAAINLPAGSVGTRQLQNQAIDGGQAESRRASPRASAPGQLTWTWDGAWRVRRHRAATFTSVNSGASAKW